MSEKERSTSSSSSDTDSDSDSSSSSNTSSTSHSSGSTSSSSTSRHSAEMQPPKEKSVEKEKIAEKIAEKNDEPAAIEAQSPESRTPEHKSKKSQLERHISVEKSPEPKESLVRETTPPLAPPPPQEEIVEKTAVADEKEEGEHVESDEEQKVEKAPAADVVIEKDPKAVRTSESVTENGINGNGIAKGDDEEKKDKRVDRDRSRDRVKDRKRDRSPARDSKYTNRDDRRRRDVRRGRNQRRRSRSRSSSRSRSRSRSRSDRRRRHRRSNSRQRRNDRIDSKRSGQSNRNRSRTPPSKSTDDKHNAEAIARQQQKTVDILTSKTGGAYIPPAKLRLLQAEITDKTSAAYQRIAWEALKKSIHGYINKVNVDNIAIITRALLKENVVRGRGLLCRSIIQAQTASPTFTHVYAALVAIINSKFPNIGELLLHRLVIQFKRGFRRNDKAVCLSSSRFIAHLINQRIAHEILALETLTLLVETPTDDSVEVAIAFLKECGMKLQEVSSKGVNAIFEMLKNILHEGKLEKRVQYMIEVVFQVRKDGFKDHIAVAKALELVEEDDQFTHLIMLDEATDTQDILNVFHFDAEYAVNEDKYKGLSKELLGSGASDSDGNASGSGSSDGSDSDEEEEREAARAKEDVIIDQTETNLVALRRTIYLTIHSSLDYEECAHKLMKMELKPGQEMELCHMFLDCCAEQRTYEKFYGLLAQRFCMINKVYIEPFEEILRDTYGTTHRLDTNRLRNVGKFFAHLLFTDAIRWEVLGCIQLSEEETTSSSRIFIKILFQELAEYMGMSKLNARLKDATLQNAFAGLFPRDNPRNTRFAINFFTSIGLGGLTDELREHLKNAPKLMPPPVQQPTAITVDSSSGSGSSSSDSSSSSSSSSDSSDSSSSSSSSDTSSSSDSSSSDHETDKKKKNKKKKSESNKKSKAKKEVDKGNGKNDKKKKKSKKDSDIEVHKKKTKAENRNRKDDEPRRKSTKRSRERSRQRSRECSRSRDHKRARRSRSQNRKTNGSTDAQRRHNDIDTEKPTSHERKRKVIENDEFNRKKLKNQSDDNNTRCSRDRDDRRKYERRSRERRRNSRDRDGRKRDRKSAEKNHREKRRDSPQRRHEREVSSERG